MHFASKRHLSSQLPDLQVVDAIDMNNFYQDQSFEILLDKGTLDAVDLVVNDNKNIHHHAEIKKNKISSRCCCSSEYIRIVKPGGYICIVSCRWPLKRRLECFQNCPVQLQSVQVHKGVGQEHAPSGFGIFVLQKNIPNNGFKFDVSQLDLKKYMIQDETNTSYRQQPPSPEKINNQTESGNTNRSNDSDFTCYEETDTIFGILSATLESC